MDCGMRILQDCFRAVAGNRKGMDAGRGVWVVRATVQWGLLLCTPLCSGLDKGVYLGCHPNSDNRNRQIS